MKIEMKIEEVEVIRQSDRTGLFFMASNQEEINDGDSPIIAYADITVRADESLDVEAAMFRDVSDEIRPVKFRIDPGRVRSTTELFQGVLNYLNDGRWDEIKLK